MKAKAKIAVSLCVLVTMRCGRLIGRVIGNPPGRELVVLYYHAVPRRHAAGFARQMAWLARHADVVAADWSWKAEQVGQDRRRLTIAITFDDALQSVIDHALPILDSLGFPCTIFVPAGCMGAVPAWEIEGATKHQERVTDLAQLKLLSSRLVTIGSHTMSHSHLPRLSAEAIAAEVGHSRDTLSQELGRRVDLLAFPYGDYDSNVVEVCGNAGYRHVFTIEPLPVKAGSNGMVRGRVGVEPNDGPLAFSLKAFGAYQWMPFASAIKAKFFGHG